ncbi:MAG TPA: YhgE/Pip domain-containing protein [Candidatus Corynebacterium avicola]|uniref:YhgE/Pip domain-containing protein n=1 Tax=Candidatus Corynebacterium avicola TaxID=2838527 RepID=A0A9D1RNV8_9CORY|nr:YhgE/Pip domain-containing protein [Candidatus Corynebacterium avicola]
MIIIGVMIIPALYAWVNVAAFWDPYGNTGNVDVAVVNEDEGGESDLTGPIDVGEQVVSQLKENEELGWQFMDAEEADDALKNGDVYGSITVPSTFTSDILSIFEGTYSPPTLKYQVNEKTSAISPKITDQGATTLDSTIDSVVKERVSEAVTTELTSGGGDLEQRLADSQNNAANAFDETADTMASASASLTRIQGRLDEAKPTIDSTQQALRSVDGTLDEANTALTQVQSIMSEVQTQIDNFSEAATTAYLESTGALAEGTSAASGAISSVTGELERAGTGIDSALRDASGFTSQSERAIAQLERLIDGAAIGAGAAGPLQDALDDLRSQNEANSDLVDSLTGLQTDASSALDAVSGASDAMAAATQDTRDSAGGIQSATGDALPQLQAAISRVNATAGSFAGSLKSTQTMLTEADSLLDGAKDTLDGTGEVLGEFADEVTGIENGLETAKTDILALNAASEGGLLDTVTSLDSDGVSRFVASPANVESHAVYPVKNYGSGMAALFTNLALWIGAFMLMVTFRVEVDKKGVKRLTVGQAYRGRLMLLAVLGLGQGLVVSVGDLLLGVQTANTFAFIGTSMLTGLAYLSIVYGLVATLGHVGRIIAVVLAFLQIPGASGMYPIEMTPAFFQAIYPLLPFTYGIDAMRETIGGFYGDHYWRAMGTLAVMTVIALVVGTLARRFMSNVNVQVNKELESTGLVLSERVEVVGSSYRLSDVIYALRDRDAFREEMDNKWKPLRENYDRLLRGAVIVGIAGAVVLGIIARFTSTQKAMIFGIVCLWMLLVVGFILVLYYVKRSYANAHELAELPESELQTAVAGVGGSSVIQDDPDDPDDPDGPDDPKPDDADGSDDTADADTDSDDKDSKGGQA